MSESSGHSPTGSVPISVSPQFYTGTARLIPQHGREDLLRQLKPRNPLACSPEGPTDTGLGSRAPPLPLLPSARHTFHAKGPRAWPGGRRWDPAGGAHKTPRLRGASRPRAVLRGLPPGLFLTAAGGKRRRTEGKRPVRRPRRPGAVPEATISRRPPQRPQPLQPSRCRPRHRHGRLRPPRRPAAPPPPPSFPHHYAPLRRRRRRRRARPSLRSRLLPAARRLSGLSRRRARGAGGTQAAVSSSSPPSPPSSPAPPAGSAQRARGSRGAMLAAAFTTENASARAGAKPGEAAGASRAGWRPGPPRAQFARSLVRSLARSLTHRVSSARRRRRAFGAAEDALGES